MIHNQPRVLFVEDDEIDQLAFKRLVQRENLPYRYIIAKSSAEARRILATELFDVILTDHNLGDGDAFDIFTAVTDIPIIVMTGAGDEATAVKAMKAGAADYLIKDTERQYLTALPVTVEKALRHKQTEIALRRRDLLLQGVATAMNQLLTTADYNTAIHSALAIIGEAALVDRVYIFENHPHPQNGEPACSQRFEWVRPGITPQLDNPLLQNRLWNTFGLTRWYELLASGKPVSGPVCDFPAAEREILDPQEILSLFVMPILIGTDFWGYIGFDDCHTARHWSPAEMAILWTMATGIGGALERQRAEIALQRYTAELQARNEELDAYAHTVAHDLKAPLATIVGFAALLADGSTLLTDPRAKEDLALIVRHGRKMSRIIDDLLILAGIRHKEIEPTSLNMAGIVAEAQQRLAQMIEEYEAQIILPVTWPLVLGYAPWVEEVWVNYLSNAIKHGGRRPRLELGATPEADGVCFWVQDNGPGLTPKQQAQLFRQFTRFSGDEVEGHGLGLSIVYRIVKKLGGQTGVRSEGPGQGAVFYFTLPGQPVG